MPLIGSRKRRAKRVTSLKPNASFSDRIQELLKDQSAFLRLSICICALAVTVLAIEAWRAPFRYRLGDRPAEGICARTSFRLINEGETERLRNERTRRVPFYFSHDPSLLNGLAARLRIDLGNIAQATTLADLESESSSAFGLTPEAGADETATESKEDEFATMKSAVSTGGTSVGNQIDELVADFTNFIDPLTEFGVADADELSRNGIRGNDTMTVLSLDETPIRTTVVSEVLMAEMVKNTGQIGKSWNQFPNLVVIRPMLETWLVGQAPATLRYDEEFTLESRQKIRDSIVEYDSYDVGTVLIEPGKRIDLQRLQLLQAEYDAIDAQQTSMSRLTRIATAVTLLSVLGFLVGYYLINNEYDLAHSARRVGVFLAAMVITIAAARIVSLDPWRAEIIPVLFTTMVIAIAYNQVLAVLTSFTLVLIITTSSVGTIGEFVLLLSVSTVAIIPLSRVSSRSLIVKLGFLAAGVYFVMSLCTQVIQSHNLVSLLESPEPYLQALKGAGWCLVAGYFVAGSLPFLESGFGFVTDISLLELSDVSHPLLQELVRKAPGTYNHSIAVATMGEAAADQIGANGLLVRVGAYFHDIGKMLKPQYFIENMAESDRGLHDNLAPAMSTLIIIGHVKDGVDLARQHNLPEKLVQFIEQHHGTTLVEYFYREATRQIEFDPDHKTNAEEATFRYPGPKPQSREAGVLMLTDAVESASRTLSDPTPKRIESLVRDILMKRLLDGQFDNCALTLNDLKTVESSLVKSLIGIFHARIAYPDAKTA